MDDPVNIWCGPDDLPTQFGRRHTINLDSVLKSHNVHVKIANITDKLAQNLPPVILDLIEIASYVYAGDQCITRGGKTLPKNGKDWKREFHYHIPVRSPGTWQNDEVKAALVNTLQFLSDDYYEINFRQSIKTANLADYFDFDKGKPWFDADRVMLFSGGLDSLAGLCETIKTGTDRIILVSHRSAPQTDNLQKNLLVDFVRLTDSEKRLLHVPVWINKSEDLTKDTHQRTRSFLYASLAGSLAYLHNLNQAYFYENGITSSNLAIAPSVLGSRASRTTHPRALKGFSLLFSTLFDREFSFENPFFWKTKADVVKTIIDCGAGNIIRHTRSCSHVRTADPVGNHCGVCSQCVGRRLAIMANSAEAHEPDSMYMTKLPLDPIPKDSERAMVELIIKAAREFSKMTPGEFIYSFPQVTDILGSLPMKADDSAPLVFELHQRHGRQVCQSLGEIVTSNESIIAQGDVPANSLLSMIFGQSTEAASKLVTKPKIELLEGTRWEDITIEIVGNDAAKILIGDLPQAATALNMGLWDRKKRLPNKVWELLVDFAEAGGHLLKTSKERRRDWQPKDYERLRKALRDFFHLKDDPLPYTKNAGYKTRFRILYDRTVKL
jgi:7-cyano-7-deazaguanine synthase in queuosine biosynthesis